MPWWTAWSKRQFSNGCQTSSAVNRPTQRLARLLGRNEPWPQSWKTMNVRSRKPAVGSSRPSVSQIESPQVAYMSAVSSR